MELGLRAEAVLRSSTFKHVIDHLSEQYTNAILTSDPGQTVERERNYHLHHALNHIVQQLGAYSAAAQELITEDQRVEEGQQEDNE